jgi:glycosyltransferase involved in cell wall biosynthesis
VSRLGFVQRAGVAARHPAVLFISWSAVAGRSAEIAQALGGAALAVFPTSEGRRPPVAFRYLVAGALTAWTLLRRAPRAVIVTNPPVVAGLLALGWARLVHVPLALDSHPGSFGRMGDTVSGRLQSVTRFLVRHAAVTLVTTPELGAVVERWGGRALVLHEVPGPWAPCEPERATGHRPVVVLAARFAPDEPVAAALEAARLLPSVDFACTGRLEDLAPAVRRGAAPNVRLVGFLEAAAYRKLVCEADVVLSLTTEPTSVMRSAYEAVYAQKPLVVSGWPIDRELFPDAILVENDASSIAAGIEEALARRDELDRRAGPARERQVARVELQLAELRGALGLAAGTGGGGAGPDR